MDRKKLVIADLTVETFDTSAENGPRGTVHAHGHTDSYNPVRHRPAARATRARPQCNAVVTCFQTEPCFPTCNGADACNTSTCNISQGYSCATCACDCIT
ncbi:MAG TPA: hypothetical protein VGX50_13765 [Longimicrobium sp.]|jgi:hypothetical protein|nr:hypothetical protein [Longimicrobium sp.]